MTQLWGCASLYDCGWTGPQPGRKDGIEFCPNCGGFVAQRGQPHEKKPQPEHDAPGVNPCEAPSITDDEAVTLAIGVGGALFSGNAGNERTYIMSRSDIGRFARAVQKGSTSGVNASDGSRRGEA